ncbi:MAG TPA: potassium channel protein [Candidatus Limnocylindrales bacterium]|nr:potassium channel protein [Candidatus Limnocylindrales bacterium]
MRTRLPTILVASPIIRRVAWHLRRVSGQLDRRFFLSIAEGIVGFVVIAAILVTALEKAWTFESLFDSINWGIATVLGQGSADYVTSPGGRVVSWLLILFGVALLGTITGALVALVIDFLLKEGQGMGASGYRDHIVICGWNATARDLVDELRGDEYTTRVVVIHEADKNPAGEGVYFVKGDPTSTSDLLRAGIAEASAALVFPAEPTNDADMRSILTIMAIESIAPGVRTVAEVNNPRHVDHFRRAHADEVLVTSRLASRLLARSALYPGLTELVTDIVSGGEGSELYRVTLPDDYLGLSIDEVSTRLRAEHGATLLAISGAERTYVNPPPDFRLKPGDDALVVAESLGTLAPLRRRPAGLRAAPSASAASPRPAG